jgi:ATP-binding cassette subfamily G (WHITE) protein 2 (SNQ2)
MYRRAAYPIANMLADLPFSATRVFIYNVVIYFMTRLDRSARGFWTYHLIVYLIFLVMQAFFRAFGLIFRDFDTAFRVSVIFAMHIFQYTGAWVPLAAMKRWLFWIVSYFADVDGNFHVAYNFSLLVLY